MEKFYPVLMASPLFGGIDREDLQSLLGCLQAQLLTAQKGEPVFLEGEPAGFVGIVLEGSVQVVRDDYYGDRSVIAVAETGDIFAEAFACAEIDRMPVSGFARQNSKVLMLSCRKMLTVCSNACRFHNRLVKNLLQVVAQKSLELTQKIRFMSEKTTRQKLMAYLSDQAKRAGSRDFSIPLDRQALADYLGVERSAMSAELSKLRTDGVLETKGSRFTLLKG